MNFSAHNGMYVPPQCLSACLKAQCLPACLKAAHSTAALLLWWAQVMRRYHIQNRDDYKKYNKIVGMITKMTNMLKQLDPQDTTRVELTDQLLDK
jgi:hypothetical protein